MTESASEQTARPASKDVDLSAEIIEKIDRTVGERVTCRKISGSKYRCNWWSPQTNTKQDNPRMSGLLVTTHVVSRSRFLTVVRNEKGLVISDVPHA